MTENDSTLRRKPLKRPSQARAKVTVQAIYDAFVRILTLRGWAGVTTRAVALETGIAIGTLYDYFPNKDAILSGYVRHCVDAMLTRIAGDAIARANLDWRTRIRMLVRVTCDIRLPGMPYFDREMLMLEARVAEAKHHQRVYQELSARWRETFAAGSDMPHVLAAETVDALFAAALGARRYRLLAQADDGAEWIEELVEICIARVLRPQ